MYADPQQPAPTSHAAQTVKALGAHADPLTLATAMIWWGRGAHRDVEKAVTKKGTNSLKQKARRLASYENIPYSAALARLSSLEAHECELAATTDAPTHYGNQDVGLVARLMAPVIASQRQSIARTMAPVIEMQRQSAARMLAPVIEAQRQSIARTMAPVIEAQRARQEVTRRLMAPVIASQRQSIARTMAPVIEMQRQSAARMLAPVIEAQRQSIARTMAAPPAIKVFRTPMARLPKSVTTTIAQSMFRA
ncbi:hypothetical protein ACH492_35175 [Streptomyces sp. NPDC019443]|uniref:hypothetical protein n=1 Tax=Streptomyces sp. NPDC019443 TaxID=3365061 RepID=UPI0037A3DC92